MLSQLRNLETVMMMPNTLCLFEQLYPIQLCQIHQRGNNGSLLFRKATSLPCTLSPKQMQESQFQNASRSCGDCIVSSTCSVTSSPLRFFEAYTK